MPALKDVGGEIAAQVSALRFLIEIALSNWMLSMTVEDAERFAGEMKGLTRTVTIRDPAILEDGGEAIAFRLGELVREIVDSAAERVPR